MRMVGCEKYRKEIGIIPIEKIYDDIIKVWGVGGKLLPVTWPLSVRVWSVNIWPKSC